MMAVNKMILFLLPFLSTIEATGIVGGSPTAPGAFPWAAHITSHSLHEGDHHCGGTVLNKMWVLTAAHCLSAIGGNVYTSVDLVLGTNKISDMSAPGRRDLHSEEFYTHPEWLSTGNWIDFDIGLIRLPEPLDFNDYISPACLPTSADSANDFAGEMATAVGWGRTSDSSQDLSDDLMQVELEVMDNVLCAADYGPMINDGHLCTETNYGKQGICAGDSGSPLHYHDGECWKVIGLADWINKGMCEDGKPQGFQRVTHHLDWILDTSSSK